MALFDVHPWLRFGVGLLAGCWIGAAIGMGIALLLASRRVKQLETANMLLRIKLRARERPRRTGTSGPGPVLVIPPGASRPARSPRPAASGE
jgi:hypothetical protein